MKTNSHKRKQYQAAVKVSIARKHLIEKQNVSDLCDEYGIVPSVYYRWQKQFFEGGAAAFKTIKKTVVSRLQQEVQQPKKSSPAKMRSWGGHGRVR